MDKRLQPLRRIGRGGWSRRIESGCSQERGGRHSHSTARDSSGSCCSCTGAAEARQRRVEIYSKRKDGCEGHYLNSRIEGTRDDSKTQTLLTFLECAYVAQTNSKLFEQDVQVWADGLAFLIADGTTLHSDHGDCLGHQERETLECWTAWSKHLRVSLSKI